MCVFSTQSDCDALNRGARAKRAQPNCSAPTRDRSLTGAWIALDDATVENGCLWVIPGSHRPGVIWPAKEHDDERFDCVVEAFDFPYTDDDAVAVEVEVTAGSIVFFNGYLLHRSLPNRAAGGFRRALVNHYMSAESLLPWRYDGKGALGVASFDFRDIVMIAGRDPYAWKGMEDLSFSAHPPGPGRRLPVADERGRELSARNSVMRVLRQGNRRFPA